MKKEGSAINAAAPLTGVRSAEAWIRRQRIIAILRLDSTDHVSGIARTLAQHGITVIEITADRPHASASLRQVRRELGGKVLLGAGTVLDPGTVGSVAAAGAEFCVAPNLDPEVVTACAKLGMLAIPGVFTPTEVVAAQRMGLQLVKLFPCGGLSPGFLCALRAPFPSMGFIPTGGIDLASIPRWLQAGACAVGLGSALVGRDGSGNGIAERVRRLNTVMAEAGYQDGNSGADSRLRTKQADGGRAGER
jgi:2-dehydro-3-deoxyphosphogluconate aldolase/(4S)-4-hydroxy-2-oxoglutarate aldolase